MYRHDRYVAASMSTRVAKPLSDRWWSYTGADMRLVDYTLAKRAKLTELRGGRLARTDVCDAHPELLRAARNVGERTRVPCPVCAEEPLVHVTYVFGDALHQRSGRVWPRDGLADLHRSMDEVACYVVEVCTACYWNHLAQRYLLGRRHVG
jgi:hypothetical protein